LCNSAKEKLQVLKAMHEYKMRCLSSQQRTVPNVIGQSVGNQPAVSNQPIGSPSLGSSTLSVQAMSNQPLGASAGQLGSAALQMPNPPAPRPAIPTTNPAPLPNSGLQNSGALGLGGQSAFSSPLWGFDASVAVAEATAISSSASATNAPEIGVSTTAPMPDSLFMQDSGPATSMGMASTSRLIVANTDLNPAARDFAPLYSRGRSQPQQPVTSIGGASGSSSFMAELDGIHSDANDGLLNNGNLLDNSRMVSPTQNAMNGTGSLSGSRLATYSSQDSGLKGHDSLFKSQDPVYRPAGHDPIGPVGHDPIGPPNTKDSLFSTKTHQDSLYSGASQDSLFSNGRDSLFSKESTNVSSPEPWLFEGLSNGLNGLDLTQNLSQ